MAKDGLGLERRLCACSVGLLVLSGWHLSR